MDTSGIITTVAGNGTFGYGGDGGPATQARLSYPYGVAVDVTGNIYIADYLNNRIRKVDTDGIIITVAGNGTYGYGGDGGPPTEAELAYPVGMAVDASGNLYIGDRSNHRVRKVSPFSIPTALTTMENLPLPKRMVWDIFSAALDAIKRPSIWIQELSFTSSAMIRITNWFQLPIGLAILRLLTETQLAYPFPSLLLMELPLL